MWVPLRPPVACTSAQVNIIEAYYRDRPGFFVDPERKGPDSYIVKIYQWQ